MCEGDLSSIITERVMPHMENKIKVLFMNEVQAAQTHWLWKPFIPRGKVTIVQGDPGEGKSTLMLALAAAVTKGYDFPDCTKLGAVPDVVLYQNAEDGLSDTVRPRLDAAGADCSMIFCCPDEENPLEIMDGRLAKLIEGARPVLAVLDPLQAFLGSEVDMHRANEIRPLMSYLASLAERTGTAIVLVGHMNKMQGSKAIYRGLGSIDLTAAARSVLLVAKDPDHPENRVILQIKNSLAPMAKPCAFTLKDGKFVWLGDYDIRTEKLLSGEPSVQKVTAVQTAEQFLKETFSGGGKTIPQSEILADAEDAGISETTLMRAKKALGLRSVKKHSEWHWTNQMFDTVV